MISVRIQLLTLALVILMTARPTARGDYFYTDTGRGAVSVTTYPSTDFFGELQPGLARIVFDSTWHASGAQPEFLDSVAFNTDLALAPSQITVPQGWTLTPNGTAPGFGRFSWFLKTTNPRPSDFIVNVTVNGLGGNASASHFWLPSMGAPPSTPATFAFHDGVIDFQEGPDRGSWVPVPQGPDTGWFSVDARPPEFASVTSTPEPATITLLGIGIAGMAGYGWRRRKQQAA